MTHEEARTPRGRSVVDHRERILTAIRPLAPVRRPIAETLHRTLAEDVTARIDVPGFDNSAMDGYAVRAADVASATPATPVSLIVAGDLPAGSPENPTMRAGEAVRIMTGARIPSDADSVVPLEDTDGGSAAVLVRRAPTPAAHIRRAGSDVRAGDGVLTAGCILSPPDLAAAAATGARSMLVRPAPRVAVLSTGSELRPAGEKLKAGQIYDSNSVLLAAAVVDCGGLPVQLGSVADDEGALHALLERIAPTIDAIITTGGVSVGAYDVVKAVLAPLGVWFGSVQMQPGKPQGFGVWPAPDGSTPTPIFALPGNPVGVFVSFEQFVRPALLAMQGRREVLRDGIRAVVTEAWPSSLGRTQCMPVIVDRHPDGTSSVRPASPGGSGSSLVASLARANALATIAESVTEVRVGDVVDITLIR